MKVAVYQITNIMVGSFAIIYDRIVPHNARLDTRRQIA